MNSEMPSGEGSGTYSAGGSATGGMPPDNNPGGGDGGIPPGHDPGHNQSGNNVDENNQNNQQNNQNNLQVNQDIQQVNTNIDPYVRGQDLFVLDTLYSYMNNYAHENHKGVVYTKITYLLRSTGRSIRNNILKVFQIYSNV